MTDDREAIFSAVRQAVTDLTERTALPDYDPAVTISKAGHRPEDTVALWRETTAQVNGDTLIGWEALGPYLREVASGVGYCDPELWESFKPHCPEGIQIETVFSRSRLDDYLFGITRASGAIAESGTVILSDRETSSRLGALAPWVHVAVLPRSRLMRTVPEAITQLGNDPNLIWVTGPSKTADVEGILIEGVHGPCHQAVVLVDD